MFISNLVGSAFWYCGAVEYGGDIRYYSSGYLAYKNLKAHDLKMIIYLFESS